jgi:hypothetical protein
MQQTYKPIFQINPLQMLINNNYSGTLNIQNLIQINKIYEMMKESILQENNLHNQQQQNNINSDGSNNNYNNNNNTNNNPNYPINIQGVTNIFTTIKTNNKLFMTIKDKKIFNIIKDNNSEKVNNFF